MTQKKKKKPQNKLGWIDKMSDMDYNGSQIETP